MNAPAISLQQVSKVYQTDRVETTALDQINLSIAQGEFVSIMGPSGCGKSTLLNLMGLLDAPSSGDIRILDQPVAHLKEKQLAGIRNRQIGFVFQSFHLVPDLSVLDNVEIPLLYRSVSSADRRQAAREALERVGLKARMSHYPTQLSGGQQQRVAIARAIVGQPAILYADEPTGNLDSHMGEEIMTILNDLNQQSGTTVVMVTHDQQQADQTGRIVRIHDGQMIQ